MKCENCGNKINNIGRTIYGFCNGFFGRDDYENKIIIAEGDRWVVCRYLEKDEDYSTTFCKFKDEDEKNNLILEWSVK